MIMKRLIKKAVIALHKKLDKTITGWQPTTNEVAPVTAFHSLSPINDADADQYIEALTWALDNRKKKSIYNIALTGPYGSGKSSILKTFQQKNENKDYIFLEISLATFKEELLENSTTTKDELEEGADNDTQTPTS